MPTSGVPPAPGAPPPTVPPNAPAVDENAVMSDMQALVRRSYQALQATDQSAVGSAQATLGSDQQAIGNDQQTLGRDQQTVTIDQQAVGKAAAAVTATNVLIQSDQAAVAAAKAASTAVGNKQADDKQHMEAIAVQLYEGLPTTTADMADAPTGGVILSSQPETVVPVLQQAQAQIDQQQYLNTLITNDHATLNGDTAQRKRAADAVKAAEAKLNKDSDALPGEQQQVANANQQVGKSQAVVAADQQKMSSDQQRVAGDQQAVAAAQQKQQGDQNALNGALAALNGPPVPRAPGDATPTIMGPTVLTPQDLAGWFNSQHYNDTTPTPVIQYAQWYVSEGKAEGVRGDIAFAQAVIETGGFSNPDSQTANNYAGIGHCDTCGGGMPFPSPQMGVRGQIQLLKTYAVPGLTSPQLANPPALPQLAPEAQHVRGCCGTWQSLTGVWASSPIYGPVIMGQYLSMLNYGMTQPVPPASVGPGPPGGGPPGAATNSGGPPTPQTPQLAPPP